MLAQAVELLVDEDGGSDKARGSKACSLFAPQD